MSVKRSLLWQLRKKRSRDTVLYICLKQGHLHWGEKNCTVKKACVYRKQRNRHRRSLCIKRFPVEKSSEMAYSVTEPLSATVTTDHTLLSSEEQVLMQTATVEVENCQKLRKTDHQSVSRHRQPRNLHRQRARRKTPIANHRIRNINSVHIQCVKTQRASHSCHWTPAVNKELITTAINSQCYTQLRVNVIPR